MRQVVLMMVVSLVLIGCRVSEGPQVTAGRLDSYELLLDRCRFIKVLTNSKNMASYHSISQQK